MSQQRSRWSWRQRLLLISGIFIFVGVIMLIVDMAIRDDWSFLKLAWFAIVILVTLAIVAKAFRAQQPGGTGHR